MNIVFVSRDYAPGAALAGVAEACLKSGHSVFTHFSKGGEFSETPADIKRSLEGASMLVTGMAHSPEMAEIELCAIKEASQRGIPIALYADTWGCASREWFEEVRKYVSLLFVVNDDEATKARPLFPNAQVVAAGNPLWQAAAFPTMTREKVREQFGLIEEAFTVFLTCRKEAHINVPHIQAVLEAIAGIGGYPIRVLASVHPNAPEPAQYDALFAGHSFIQKVTGKAMDILPGVDVVVNAGSGAGIEAMYQRTPLIEFTTPKLEDEVERLHGTRVWQLVADRVASPARNASEIATLLDIAHTGAGGNVFETARHMAEEKYPLPAHPHVATQIMASEILAKLKEV